MTSPLSPDGRLAVYDFASGDPVFGADIPGVFVHPYDVALQSATGRFFVADYGALGTGQFVYAFGRGTPTVIDGSNSLGSVLGPWGVAVSPNSGAAYVSDAHSEVHVFPAVVSSVSEVSPSSGPVTGGTLIDVKGTNLGAVSTVTFNGVPGEIVGYPEPATVKVKAPPMPSAGAVTVNVIWGANTAGKVGAFTYTAVAPGKATAVSGVPRATSR